MDGVGKVGRFGRLEGSFPNSVTGSEIEQSCGGS